MIREPTPTREPTPKLLSPHDDWRYQKGLLIRWACEEMIREHPTTVSVKKLQTLLDEATQASHRACPEISV
jgi:hypothetical protein